LPVDCTPIDFKWPAVQSCGLPEQARSHTLNQRRLVKTKTQRARNQAQGKPHCADWTTGLSEYAASTTMQAWLIEMRLHRSHL